MNWKEIYTRVFLNELGKSTDPSTVKQYMHSWWMNIRNKDKCGMRLTDRGLEVVQELDLKTYEIPYPEEMPITAQVIVYLDKFIDCPYYLTKKSILVLNERKAIELTLFSGDVRKYGYIKAMKRPTQKD
jgi:hypothetical protein